MKYKNIREEELKNRIAEDYFWKFDCKKIIGNIDFCVSLHHSNKELFEQHSLLWAEAKKGSADIFKALVQLILTIGKERTFDRYLPPQMLGAFDYEKIAFLPYNEINEVFYINDFNWNVAPSDHSTKEFKIVYEKVRSIIENKALLFFFHKDDKELKKFINENFVIGKFGLTKIQIDKNNFIVIYNKWLQVVKPTIAVNWDIARKYGIIDGDFYLADLLSEDNITLKEKLFVLLKKDHYELDRKIDEAGMFTSKRTDFTDNQVAHTQFWNKYQRPPKEEYWDYIIERRDLLVPQDIRERKGSFFTPQIWVELSQRYLTEALGQDWQDDYVVWDCAAGTGNLLAGLTNKYNIYASTLDQQDVEVMRERIDNGANLLANHVFQFDFLNDEFKPVSQGGKLPESLYKIIIDPEKRKKLVIYINPPYAEAGSNQEKSKRQAKTGVALNNKTYFAYKDKLSKASNELFAQFFIRIYVELKNCILASFSTLKYVSSLNFVTFRKTFKAKFLKGFIVPAYTFDNVNGKFPIGFVIWNTQKDEIINKISLDIYNDKGQNIGGKNFYSFDEIGELRLNHWIKSFNSKRQSMKIGEIGVSRNDVQHVALTWIAHKADRGLAITPDSLIFDVIYFAVQHCIEVSWINDRDQFLFPNNKWEEDREFHTDCLAFALFHHQNRISSKEGTNHWIPFTEKEVNAKEKFESNFMSDFIRGRNKPHKGGINILSIVFDPGIQYETPLRFSKEAQEVFDAGKEIWKYYHSKPNINVNASLYDIKEFFYGRNDKGKMNNRSEDDTFNGLMDTLKRKLKILAVKIENKVYEYEFLKK